MIETVDVAEGDTVRVVLEGIVHCTYQGEGFGLRADPGVPDGNSIFFAEQHVISVEKLAKPLTVGDVLTADQYNARDWEQHTVLLDLDEVDALILAYCADIEDLMWISSASGNRYSIRELGRYISSVKVLHLPEAVQPAVKAKDAK